MVIQQTAAKWLTPPEQDALFVASNTLIDAFFDEYSKVNAWKRETIFLTRLGKHLPRPYFLKYTPLFYKAFGICVVSIARKLAQPIPALPASVAEQLAAWAIVEEAKAILKQQESEEGDGEESPQAFQAFINGYFPDTSFLLLFDPGHDGIDVKSSIPTTQQASLAFENWFHLFPGSAQSIHPYAGGSEQVGRAYKQWLTRREREMLATAIEVLIDEIFEDFNLEERCESEDFVLTELAWHLPSHYSSHYTPLFLKKFVVCILTVAWKLVQPKRLLLSSIAEELAAWAIFTAAKRQIELEYDAEGKEGGEQAAEYAFENVIEVFFEDEDFLFLFDKKYGGIHASPVGQMLHMTSLAFEDWTKPFTDEPERIAHPYVFR